VFILSPILLKQIAPSPSQVCTLTTHATLCLGSFTSETATRLWVRKTLRDTTQAGGCVFTVERLVCPQTPEPVGADRLTAELARIEIFFSL